VHTIFDKQLVKNVVEAQIQLESSSRKWDLKVYKRIIKRYKKRLERMVDTRMHLGHHPSIWNPKMSPYIYSKRDKMYIINLVESLFRLEQIVQVLTYQASQGKRFLFVGTEKQVTGVLGEIATGCNSFFVNAKWLGGMLTNWKTMKKSVYQLKKLEIEEKGGIFQALPKKEAASNKKQKDRLDQYLGGLRKMNYVPDVVIIVGQPTEMHAVHECQKLGLRSVTVLDTNCDPSKADLFIPANDDSVRSLAYILTPFKTAIQKGYTLYEKRKGAAYEKRKKEFELGQRKRRKQNPSQLKQSFVRKTKPSNPQPSRGKRPVLLDKTGSIQKKQPQTERTIQKKVDKGL
jgi:small subunit ribosomal protein S2